jgi:hypothetical protein
MVEERTMKTTMAEKRMTSSSLLSFDDVHDNSQGFGVSTEREEPEGPKDPQASQEPVIWKDADQIGWQNCHKVD